MVLATGLAVEARIRAGRGETRPSMHWWYAGLAGFFLLATPLSTARAGLAIALPALAAALLLTGGLPLLAIGHSKRATALTLGSAVVAIIGVRAAMGWMAVDEAEELRHTMAVATMAIGKQQSPLGSGMGGFVQVFEQGAPAKLWLAQYVNHAHNEYAQWWLTAGWPGMLVLACVLALLAASGWHLARIRGKGSNAVLASACLVAVGAVLAHSWADYPLRTTTLMTTSTALAGLLLATLNDAGRKIRSRVHRDDAMQQA
jgi:O-antigen ligase